MGPLLIRRRRVSLVLKAPSYALLSAALVTTLFGQVPSIISTYPRLNALHVPLDTVITVTFDQDIDPATLFDSTFVVHGGQRGKLSGAYTYSGGTRTAVFTPDQPFRVGERVRVTVTKGVQTVAGDALPQARNWDFTAKVLGGTGVFSRKGDYTVGSSPFSITAADLDGDGDADLAVANWGRNSMSVLLGNGDGSFAPRRIYGVGLSPVSITAADLDGDGDVDLAIANTDNDNVSVLLGNGDGTFAPKIDYDVGSIPRSITAGDLDGDGHVDLAIANSNISNVSVLLGNGDGTFAPKIDYGVGSIPSFIIAGDLSGDGHVDLAIANTNNNNVSVLLGNGNGTFAPKVDYGVGSTPRSIAGGDLAGDGNLDLAIANADNNNVSVLLSNGDGTFAPKVDYGVGLIPRSIIAADLDGDGDLELAIANRNSNNISLLLGNGDGTFASKVDYTAGPDAWSLTAADLDGDGVIDLAVARLAYNTVSVLLNQDSYSARFSPLGSELSGDVPLNYHIVFPSGLPTNLKVEHSINPGASWTLSAISGETTSLGPDSYDGTLIWQSEADLPGVDRPTVQLRVTPYTADSTGRSTATAFFRLNNNHEPVVSIGAIANEQIGDVTILYTLADDEGDTLSFAAEYSGNRGGLWQSATISGQTDGLIPASYAGSFIWDTGADLPGHEDSLTWFRITPSDDEPGTADSIIVHVDNNDPPSASFGTLPSETVISRVSIPYSLTDAENDTLSIEAAYSLDGGQLWILSEVGTPARAIVPGDYGGSVDWLAFASGLVGTTPNVQLRLLPRDYDAGPGDTLTGFTVIYYPGDYSGDLLISTDDLVQFAAAWNADPQEVAYELGPATGTVPDLAPQPDGLLDFEDLVVFAQMWNWSFANNGFAKSIPMLAKTTTSDPSLRLIQVVPDNLWEWAGSTIIRLEVAETADLMMIDGLMTVNPRQVRVRDIQAGGYLSARWEMAPLFVQTNADSSQVLFAIAGLGLKEEQGAASEAPLLTFEADLGNHGEQTLTLDYTLWNASGEPIESATLSLEIDNLLPKQYVLHQNYPNPFNPVTTIRYELPRPAKTVLLVYNIVGQQVVRLVDELLSPGYHQTIWDGRDQAGRQVASGIYIVRLTTPVWSRTMKMVLLK